MNVACNWSHICCKYKRLWTRHLLLLATIILQANNHLEKDNIYMKPQSCHCIKCTNNISYYPSVMWDTNYFSISPLKYEITFSGYERLTSTAFDGKWRTYLGLNFGWWMQRQGSYMMTPLLKKLYLMEINTSHTKGWKTDNTASLKHKWHIASGDTNIKQLVY